MDSYEQCIKQNKEKCTSEVQLSEKEYEDAKDICEANYNESINNNSDKCEEELSQNQKNLSETLKENENELTLYLENQSSEYDQALQDMEDNPEYQIPQEILQEDLEKKFKIRMNNS